MLELLKKVLKPVAPSGLEEPVAAVIREEVAPYVDSIETDALGNLICVKNGTEANPEKIMLSAHMDHIGYIVTGIPANRRRDEANHHCRFLRAGGSRLPRREGGVVRESAGQGHRH